MTDTDPPASVPPKKQADAPTAWLIRAGGQGEFADSFVENKITAVDYDIPHDLSDVSSHEEMVELVSRNSPGLDDPRPRARLLWNFVSVVRRGDRVVMPRKSNSQFALGTVTGDYEYRHDLDKMPHTVPVHWKRTNVGRDVVGKDLLDKLKKSYRPTINEIRDEDLAWRLHQLMETGLDPGPRAGSGGEDSDLADLVERFRDETGYPTDAHREQERLRKEWAGKLASANVASLSREDLLAYTNNAVDYGDYVDRGEGRRQQWIIDLDDAGYDRLLNSIHDLCWGNDELSARIDRLVDRVGGFNTDTGTLGFTGIQVSRTLAICFPEKFLPFPFANRQVGS